MPDNTNYDRINEKVREITAKYQILREKISNSEPLKQLIEPVKFISLTDFTLEMYSEIFKSYTLRLIDKFLEFLSEQGSNIPEDQLDHINTNLLDSTSLLLTSESNAADLKLLIRSSDLQEFVTTFLTPLRDIEKMNSNVGVSISPDDWDQIMDMSKRDISSVNKETIQEAKRAFFALMQKNEITDPEAQMTYLETMVELFKDLRQLAAETTGSYANDAYNNIIADCANIFSRVIMAIWLNN